MADILSKLPTQLAGVVFFFLDSPSLANISAVSKTHRKSLQSSIRLPSIFNRNFRSACASLCFLKLAAPKIVGAIKIRRLYQHKGFLDDGQMLFVLGRVGTVGVWQIRPAALETDVFGYGKAVASAFYSSLFDSDGQPSESEQESMAATAEFVASAHIKLQQLIASGDSKPRMEVVCAGELQLPKMTTGFEYGGGNLLCVELLEPGKVCLFDVSPLRRLTPGASATAAVGDCKQLCTIHTDPIFVSIVHHATFGECLCSCAPTSQENENLLRLWRADGQCLLGLCIEMPSEVFSIAFTSASEFVAVCSHDLRVYSIEEAKDEAPDFLRHVTCLCKLPLCKTAGDAAGMLIPAQWQNCFASLSDRVLSVWSFAQLDADYQPQKIALPVDVAVVLDVDVNKQFLTALIAKTEDEQDPDLHLLIWERESGKLFSQVKLPRVLSWNGEDPLSRLYSDERCVLLLRMDGGNGVHVLDFAPRVPAIVTTLVSSTLM